MTQYVINIGAIPNDGTGDPLRTAFNETNLNFDQVFAAGPVLSNIRIANNSILTTTTNGNLILAPNGIGRIQANATIVPSVANVRDLGSATQRWSTVYAQYLDVSANLNIAGNIVYNGDLNVAGNLTVQGNIIQVGNIVTETLTIQLANAASTANAANGAGITVGANDNIATVLYNSTSNVWNMNIGLSTVGNITAPYFVGNGSLLTGLAATYGNANVVTLLAGFGSNTVSTTGNISGGYILGNGSQLTGLAANYGNADVATFLANFGSNSISTTGNITSNYYFGNVAVLAGQNTRGEHAANLGAPGFTELNSNVILQITGNANSYAQINFQNISNGTHATTDYIATAEFGTDSTYFVDMGIASGNYDPTDVNNSLGNSLYPQDSYLYAMGGNSVGGQGGNLVVGTNEPGGVVRIIADGSTTDNIVATFSNVGMAIKGNIIPVANAVYSLGNSTNYWANLWVANNTIYIGGVPLGMTAGNVLTVNGNAVLTNGSNTAVSTTGNITAGNIGITGGSLTWANASIVQTSASDVSITGDGQVTIRSLDGTYQWTFDTAGNVTIPGNIVGAATIDIDNRASGNSADIQLFAADDITLQARDRSAGSTSEGGDINIFAGDSAEDGDSSGGDIQILAGDGGAANVDFGGPGGFITIQSGQGGAAIGNSGYSAESGGSLTLNAGHAGSNNGNIDLGAAGANVYIGAGDSTGNGVNGGTIYLTSGAADASALAGDVVIQAGGTWTFDGAGNLSAPGNVSAVGNITADYFIGDGSQLTGITANTGNVTFSNQIVLGTGTNDGSGGLYLAPGTDSIANSAVQYLRVRGGDALTHIHLDTGNNAYYDQYFGNDNKFVKLEAGDAGNVVVGTDDNGNSYNWTFDTAGNLTLPGNTIAINYANGNLAFGTVTFNNEAVIGTGTSNTQSGLYLAPDPVSLANDLYLRVRGNILDEPTHIHFDTGNNQYYNLIIGDDNKYIQLANTGNIVINTNNYAGNTAQWNFDTTGNLTLPQGGVVYETNIPDGGLNGKTIALKPQGGTNADQQLLIYPTVNDANHLHLTSGNFIQYRIVLR
jgi:hypothetical protein